MIRMIALGGAVLVALCALPLRGEELYDLRGPAPQPGLRIDQVERMEMTDGQLSLRVNNGQPQTEKMEVISEIRSRYDILRVRSGEPVMVRQKVLSDKSLTRSFAGGQPTLISDHSPLLGQVILHELEEGYWKATMISNQPTEEQKEELDLLDAEVAGWSWYPEKKVAVGYMWAPQPAEIKRYLGKGCREVDGEVICKFEKVIQREGEPYAMISLKLDLYGKMHGGTDEDMKFKYKGRGLIYRQLSTGIDRQYNMKGTLTSSYRLTEQEISTSVELNAPFEFNGVQKVVTE